MLDAIPDPDPDSYRRGDVAAPKSGSFRINLVFALLLAIGYPLAITGVCQLALLHQARGSAVASGGSGTASPQQGALHRSGKDRNLGNGRVNVQLQNPEARFSAKH